MLLRIYQILLYLVQPLLWLRLLLRSRKSPAYRRRWGERYGFCHGKVAAGGIMLHSVSVGETVAAIPIVKALQHRYPKLPITITTMTPTGSERVLAVFGKEVHHVYLPYDLPCSVNRFLNHVNPKLVIIMETELWPNLIHALYRRKIPLVIANARLSERSAARYKKIGGLIRGVLQHITLIAAQHQEDGQRFIELGLKQSQLAITGSLKCDFSVTPELAAQAATLRRQWAAYRPVWIAGSTHEGEESIILEAHHRLMEHHRDLLLILVPRHPERFHTAQELTKRAGFSYTLRSSGQPPATHAQVVIGDTMGELMLLYGVADLAFVGGSLVEKGGQNPLEAAAHTIPLLMGPHTFNFKHICATLESAEGLITVVDATSLVEKITDLLGDENTRLYHGFHAVTVLRKNQGALQRLLRLLEPYLPDRIH